MDHPSRCACLWCRSGAVAPPETQRKNPSVQNPSVRVGRNPQGRGLSPEGRQRGGQASTSAKRQAARLNGRKGGRPPGRRPSA